MPNLRSPCIHLCSFSLRSLSFRRLIRVQSSASCAATRWHVSLESPNARGTSADTAIPWMRARLYIHTYVRALLSSRNITFSALEKPRPRDDSGSWANFIWNKSKEQLNVDSKRRWTVSTNFFFVLVSPILKNNISGKVTLPCFWIE